MQSKAQSFVTLWVTTLPQLVHKAAAISSHQSNVKPVNAYCLLARRAKCEGLADEGRVFLPSPPAPLPQVGERS